MGLWFRKKPKCYPSDLTRTQWKLLDDALHTRGRHGAGRKKCPSMGIIDTQSVKTTERGGPRGKDPFKKVNGRKRQWSTRRA